MTGDVKDIDWYAPSGEKIIPGTQDLSVTRTDEVTSTFIIYHADVDDAGIYKCVARNGDKEAQATVQVKIFRESRLLYSQMNSTRSAEVTCCDLRDYVFKLLVGKLLDPFDLLPSEGWKSVALPESLPCSRTNYICIDEMKMILANNFRWKCNC